MTEKSYPDTYPITPFAGSDTAAAGTVLLWRTPTGWAEKLSDGTIHQISPDQAYDIATTSTAGLSHKAIAGVVKELNASIADAAKPELQEIRIGETTGTISWPASFTPSNTDGVAIVRAREATTVTPSASHTLGGATDYESAWSLPATLRELDLVLRFAFPKNAPAGSSFQALIATAGNDALQISGSASGSNWTEMTTAGTTARIEYKNWIIYSVAFRSPTVAMGGPFSLFFVCTPGKVALPCIYKPADLPVAGTVDGMRLTDKVTNEFVDYKLSDLAAIRNAIALDNTGFVLDGGALFTAAEAIDRDFVHIRTDGQIEVARNTVDSKAADGYVSGFVAANGTTQVFGTGSKFPVGDFGLVGVPAVARLYLGDGGATLTNTGTNRYFQEVALVRNGTAYLNFQDKGYWVAAL
jgi:hypothetical protein